MRTGRAAVPGTVLAVALASLLLFSGLLAGLVNRNVLDGPEFAAHVDAVRQDPAVSQQIGSAITRELLLAVPDLVAVRPLVEAAATSLVASPQFSPIVRTATAKLHRAFTDDSADQVALRLADLGAVLAGVLLVISPEFASRVPPDLDVTLAQVGDQSFAADTIRLARIVGVLAWLLPGLALLVFGFALWRASDRLRMEVRIGWAVVAAGLGVGSAAFLGTLAASLADEDTLTGSLAAAAWHEVVSDFWWTAAVPVIAGGLLVGAARVSLPDAGFTTQARALLGWFLRPPEGRWPRVARGAILVSAGAVLALRPALVLSLLGGVSGLLLIGWGFGEFLAAARTARSGTREARTRPEGRPSPTLALGAGLTLLLALVLVDAAPADREVEAITASTACNGHVELCSRPYNDVAFPATHNAMSAADGPGWFIPEQPTGIIGQLDAGIRVLLIDSWYGQATQRPDFVATAPGSYDSALAEAERQFGPAAVDSALRLADAGRAEPSGPIRPYLCHGLCEIGGTDWETVLAEVHTWMSNHPREVVTFFVEDSVSPADTAAVFDRAGLLPFVHTQLPGQPWPTLGQMIDSGRRLVVQMERTAGGPEYPWLLPGFSFTQDTPFANPTVADLSCARERGTASSPLLLVNYWLNGFRNLVTNARQINADGVMWPYLSRCQQERGQIPNYVAVNFYNEGDLFRVVDRLNGVS